MSAGASDKSLVRRWFAALGSSDFAALNELMDDRVEFWTSASVRPGPILGREAVHERLVEVFTSGRFYAPGSFACRLEGSVAEGDQIVSNVTMTARFPNGNPYENTYFVWQRWRDGRLTYNYELFDVAHWSNQRKGPAS